MHDCLENRLGDLPMHTRPTPTLMLYGLNPDGICLDTLLGYCQDLTDPISLFSFQAEQIPVIVTSNVFLLLHATLSRHLLKKLIKSQTLLDHILTPSFQTKVIFKT